jgi:hypothetical protein
MAYERATNNQGSGGSGMSGPLYKSVAKTLAVIGAVHTAYKESGVPFSWFWEAIKKQAEKEKKGQAEASE